MQDNLETSEAQQADGAPRVIDGVTTPIQTQDPVIEALHANLNLRDALLSEP